MIKFTDLRKTLYTLLKTLHPRVFFNVAPDDAIFPYVVFDMPNSVDEGALENFVLDIDVWDIDEDTTTLEELIYTIDAALHKQTMYINNMSITIYRENGLTLTDDDPQIRRRKYVYQVRVC